MVIHNANDLDSDDYGVLYDVLYDVNELMSIGCIVSEITNALHVHIILDDKAFNALTIELPNDFDSRRNEFIDTQMTVVYDRFRRQLLGLQH